MKHVATVLGSILLGACVGHPEATTYRGTAVPAASDAVYFVVTDRFVDGDPTNNQVDQGPTGLKTFDRPITNADGHSANIGYLGGDFRGLLNNAAYIRDMGFGAIWLTPIVENPDAAFSGGFDLGEAFFADKGKTGYHGYWGVNFFETDEHLTSPGLDFADLSAALLQQHQLKTVLDIVCNHGSPAYTMPVDQPQFGKIYRADGMLIADHQNRHPSDLDPHNPLHAFFHRTPDLAELPNIDESNPLVLEYFVNAYLHWIDAGAAAFRIDTIRHMPHDYWKAFSDRIRERHPGFFMFGESFDYDAAKIAEHTYPQNGGISVLDFPGQKRITEVFSVADSDFADLTDYLHLTDGMYENPYELMTFYDNHDMPRMNADANGFIDANHWLFTSRGIPVVYYGSETAFRAGRGEHGGNRDYYGQARIREARDGPIYSALRRIARLRQNLPALQRGLQVNLSFAGDTALFLRVLETPEQAQTVLVALNKGERPIDLTPKTLISSGRWRDADSGETYRVGRDGSGPSLRVPAHGARVLVLDAPNTNTALRARLDTLQHGVGAAARRRGN
ncbi:MAG: alpha-amylase family glycosyl hydrolase [Gammaproteobacteria bacterium]